MTVLRGIEANDLELATGVLKRVLPDQGWTITRPSVSEDTVSKSAAERFQRELVKLLDVMTPALILQPLDVAVPAHLRLPGVTVFNFAPISADLLLAYLAAVGRAPDDDAAFRRALPEAAILARLDTAQICMALRFGSAADIAEGLTALLGPADNGPSLEAGFSDCFAVRIARRMVADLMDWRRGEISWSDFSHSLLLYGPLGTGKNWLARAMSNSAGIACVNASFAEWQSVGHLGDMLREMRRRFALANSAAPAILFIDEIDAMGSRTGDDKHNQNYRTQVINAFLGEMNALATKPGVIVIGACNHPDRIDPAVTRAGRFDLKIEVPMPDADAIFALLIQFLKERFPDTEIRNLSREVVGQSLAAVDAAVRATRSEARHLGQSLDLALLCKQLGLQRGPGTTDILWRFAIHEFGHTVVSAALRHGSIARMSISNNGGEVASRSAVGHGVQ